MPRRILVAVAFAVPLLVMATGCSGDTKEPVSAPIPSETPTTVVAPTEEPTVEPAKFTQPRLCADLLPASAVAELESFGYILLGGPEGKYGDDYLDGATPEQAIGGISCFWGSDETDITDIAISVAPLSSSTRAQVVGQLQQNGLNEGALEDAATFGRYGDVAGTTAIYNVLFNDSWISIISSQGGEEAYQYIVALAGDVQSVIYQ